MFQWLSAQCPQGRKVFFFGFSKGFFVTDISGLLFSTVIDTEELSWKLSEIHPFKISIVHMGGP